MTNSVSILIVEDEIIVAEDLKVQLRGMGYNVIGIADTAEKAINLIKVRQPDVILMDIKIKGDMDGIEATKKIKEIVDIPVIFTTAYTDEYLIQRMKTAQPHGYLVKPTRERELRGVIEAALYKHQMEKKIKENEIFLYNILYSIADGLITTDIEGIITFMNLAAESMTGWQKSQARGRPLHEVFTIVSEKTGKPAKNLMERIFQEDVVMGLANHTRLITRDGHSFPIYSSGTPIKDEAGHIIGAAITFQDASYDRWAAKKLNESEEKYKNLFTNANYGIILSDTEGYILDVNEKALKMLGYSLAEIVSVTSTGLHPKTDLPKYWRAMKFIQKKGAYKFTIQFKPKRKKPFPARVSATLFKINDHEIIQMIFDDIRQEIRKENALKARQQELEAILNASPDGILVVDMDGKVIHANKQFAKLWRIPDKLLRKGNDEELLHFVLEQLAEPQAFLDRVQALYKSDAIDYDKIRFKDGRIIERYSRPLMTDRKITGRVWIFRG